METPGYFYVLKYISYIIYIFYNRSLFTEATGIYQPVTDRLLASVIPFTGRVKVHF